ncbi:MAG TPA: ribosome small subunit-dependent GTPase A, partial [Gemmatimonadaceae bacterium]|nr:ribosome small subunit-dependent GTPase A [Gemmatimonadaceae bacterium]
MEAESERAVVVRGTGGVWSAYTASGETRDVSLRGRLKRDTDDGLKLAVGDAVRLERDERGGAWAIAEIYPRRSKLARRAPSGAIGERVVAANLDQVIVVFAAANPEPHPRMLDRFLVIAEANDLAARVVINKVDLVAEPAARAQFADYARAGYPMHFTSTITGYGLPELLEVLHGRTSAVSGPSGVGKSSLLNALARSDVLVADQPFATLDPTTRRTSVGNGVNILLSDTVGFVNKLPPTLVAAFRSTLEELAD